MAISISITSWLVTSNLNNMQTMSELNHDVLKNTNNVSKEISTLNYYRRRA